MPKTTLVVKGQVKVIPTCMLLPVALSACDGIFPIVSSQYSLSPGVSSASCPAHSALLLWDRPPTPFTDSISRESSLFHSSMLFYHWVKLGGRNMIFSLSIPSKLSPASFFPLEPVYGLLPRFAPCPPASEPCKPFPAFYSHSHLFLHGSLPDGSCLFLSSLKKQEQLYP